MRDIDFKLKLYFNQNVRKLDNRGEYIDIVCQVYERGKLDAEEILDIALNKDILESGEAIRVMEMITESFDNIGFDSASFYTMIKKLAIADKKNFKEIIELFYNAMKNHFDSFMIMSIFSFITNEKYSNYADKVALLREIFKKGGKKAKIIMDFAEQYFDDLEEKLLDIAKTINAYQNYGKLDTASSRMLGNNGLLAFEETYDVSLETLKHFKDYPGLETRGWIFKEEINPTELFSCVELYSQETDPTIEREIDFIAEGILEMPHEEGIKTLKKIKQMIHIK